LTRLNKEKIAAAGLALIDAKGMSGFTIRAVAEALRASPMALYYHVKDKADLARLVVSAVNRQEPMQPPTGAWRADLLAMARWARRSMTRHPAVSDLHRIYPVITPEIIIMAKRWRGLWRDSGLDRKAAMRAAEVSSIAISSFVVYVSSFQQTKPPRLKPPRGQPAALSNSTEALYELAFASIIDGLHSLLSAGGPGPSAPRKARALKR
jgi:AcrR family transcriptional regulator